MDDAPTTGRGLRRDAFSPPSSLPAARPTSRRRRRRRHADTYRELDLFGEVFERVRADYVENVTDEQLVEAAINGMLTALDPHSSYMNAKNFADMQVQVRGEFGGLGIEVTMENGLVKVVSPIDDTPAAKAGHEAGRPHHRRSTASRCMGMTPQRRGRQDARARRQRDQADDPARRHATRSTSR